MIEADDSPHQNAAGATETPQEPANDSQEPPDDAKRNPTNAKKPQQALSDNAGILRSASIISIGNIVSRIFGLLRQTVILSTFGAGLTSAYEVATLIPNNLFDAIKTGMVDSALVPVFSDINARDSRDQLWAAVSTFLSVLIVILIVLVLLMEIFYVPLGALTAIDEFDDPVLRETAYRLMRLAIPAILLLSIASVLTATLYALKRFTVPAFLPAIYNGSIVLAALIRPEAISSLIYGLLLGAVVQIVLQLWVLRDARLRWSFDIRHPVIGRILRLFTPIVGVLVVDFFVRLISYQLAVSTGDQSISYMRSATTLQQFPMGLVVTALTVAILPVLSQQATDNIEQFKATLAGGIRLVLVLILPAAIGLFAIALPIIDLLFGNGQNMYINGVFTYENVDQTARVLQLYAIGLPFAGVDQMLIFASYARKDTFSPSLVGILSMFVNVGTAIALIGVLGLFSLMVADAVKHIVHTVIMLYLLRRQIGGLAGYAIMPTALKALFAATLTGIAAYFVSFWLRGRLGTGSLNELLTVVAGGITGMLVYAMMVYLLDIREAKMLVSRLKR